jgi:hypothetical protein
MHEEDPETEPVVAVEEPAAEVGRCRLTTS